MFRQKKSLFQNLEQALFGGGYYARFEPETKRLVKKRMTVDEYLEHYPEEEIADFKQISHISDSDIEVWLKAHWRLSKELFLFWYIWLKDNLVEMREWVEKIKTNIADYHD